MRCPICDSDSESVTMVDPCSECQHAIFECLAGYPDLEDDNHILDGDYDDS